MTRTDSRNHTTGAHTHTLTATDAQMADLAVWRAMVDAKLAELEEWHAFLREPDVPLDVPDTEAQ